ncbi:MAG: hypothetical protein UR51_C0015G0003 [Candidatus Moranbacteria bacterium GW2011_GWF1_34_10]|nr:MAG: hypothetical protein UR51_C0015G0003 [Candidatus Moranbacteria bacterium GW2011_GWF1_34_10]
MKNREPASIDLELLGGDEYKCLRCGKTFFWNLGGCACGETKEVVPVESMSEFVNSLTEEDWSRISQRNREFFKNLDSVRSKNLKIEGEDPPTLFSAEKVKKFLKDE